MSTYGDLKTRIADEMKRTTLTTQIQNHVLDAVKFYGATRFALNEKQGTITTIAGTRYYDANTVAPGTLPADIAEIDTIICTVSGREYPLRRASQSELNDIDGGTSLAGDPTQFAWYAGKLRLYPTPSAARVLTLSYQYILTAMSSSGDTNFWTNEAEELIRCRAKKTLCMHVTMDAEMAGAMAVGEREALAELKKAARKLQASGHVKATRF